MASEKPENGGFLAVIDAKIAALQQLRDSFIAAMSIGALGGDIDVSQLGAIGAPQSSGAAGSTPKGPIDLPTGVFRGQGLSDAIRLYLGMAKRKQTIQEIKAALMEGGLATTSEFFDQTLSSTLYRMRKGGELLQFKDGWDLAASYPDSFRARMNDAKEPPPKSSAGKKKRRAKGKAATKKSPPKPAKPEATKPEGKAEAAA
jgi:hypothetical protein